MSCWVTIAQLIVASPANAGLLPLCINFQIREPPTTTETAEIANTVPEPAWLQNLGFDSDRFKLIEAEIILPTGAFDIEDYNRFYAPETVDGREFVKGVYVRSRPYLSNPAGYSYPVPGAPGVFATPTERDLPLVVDGGCSVVSVWYVLASENWAIAARDSDPPDAPEVYGLCNGR